MDEAVKELCNSILDNPDRWTINTHTLDDKVSGIKYWLGISGCITHTWNGNSTDEVFSSSDGLLIYAAYSEMKGYKASVAQQKVINSLKVECIRQGRQNKWWEFWK